MFVVFGVVVEWMKFWVFLIFFVVLIVFIYFVEGYWIWGGGFFLVVGFSDFVGFGIVYLVGVLVVLVGVFLFGVCKGKYGKNGEIYLIFGFNMLLVIFGMFILWFGWFGFNGGL